MSGVPFELTFYLQSPVCLTYPFVHLDGLLAHLELRRRYGDEFRCLPAKQPVQIDYFDIVPLDYSQEYGVFMGSASWFRVCEGARTRTVKIYKRFYDQGLDPDKVKGSRIDTSRGFFKSHSIPLAYLPATEVVFYGRGDVDRVRELAEGVAGIGKKVHIGFGLVKDFELVRVKDDCSLFREVDGRLVAMRAIPADRVRWASVKATLACRPPYWARESHTCCAVPGSEVRL